MHRRSRHGATGCSLTDLHERLQTCSSTELPGKAASPGPQPWFPVSLRLLYGLEGLLRILDLLQEKKVGRIKGNKK